MKKFLTIAIATLFAIPISAFSQAPPAAAGQRGGAGGGQRGGPPPGPPAGPVSRTADGKPDLNGYWDGTVRTGLANLQNRNYLVEPADNKIPYQPWAAAKAQENATQHLADEPELHCLMSGVPHQMLTQFGFQVVQTPQNVGFFWEFMHDNRIIPLTPRTHIHESIRLFQGDPIGKWEGDTLVIDTTNQNDRTWHDAAGNIHSDAIHVIERITPVDANTIRYEATVEDPKALTAPMKVVDTFRRTTTPGHELYEYDCVSGNRDLEHYTDDQGGKAKKSTPLAPGVR